MCLEDSCFSGFAKEMKKIKEEKIREENRKAKKGNGEKEKRG